MRRGGVETRVSDVVLGDKGEFGVALGEDYVGELGWGVCVLCEAVKESVIEWGFWGWFWQWNGDN